MIRSLALATLMLGLAAQAGAQTVTRLADAATVKKLETQVKMPAGAARLETYVRYYGVGKVQLYKPDGALETREVLVGTYLASTLAQNRQYAANGVTGVIGARAVPVGKSLPTIDDGGCSVVTVYYDLDKQELIPLPAYDPAKGEYLATAICNGVA